MVEKACRNPFHAIGSLLQNTSGKNVLIVKKWSIVFLVGSMR